MCILDDVKHDSYFRFQLNDYKDGVCQNEKNQQIFSYFNFINRDDFLVALLKY